MARTSTPCRALTAFCDLPLLTGDEVPYAPYAAAYADPWPGAVAMLKSATGSDFTLDTTLTRAALLGETLADFYPGPASRRDRVNTLSLKLYSGTLASREETALLGGANALALETAPGVWEVLQFATATLVAPGEWQLTNLLRGQAGTEAAMGTPTPAGARVVVLDVAPKQLGLAQSQLGIPFPWEWGPKDKPLSDPAFQSVTQSFAGAGLRPYAPCALAAAYDASGDLVLGWIRRDRNPASDNWEASETPMSESAERYDVEILDGAGAVVRTFAALSSPACTYAAVNIASDFPSGLPNPFRFTVYQRSAAIGRGPGRTAAVSFA